MKTSVITLTLVACALLTSACAHERTEMDRELALKLVDKAGRIEIVQTMNGTGASPLLGPANGSQRGPWDNYAPESQETKHVAQTCRSEPIYGLNGAYLRTATRCW